MQTFNELGLVVTNLLSFNPEWLQFKTTYQMLRRAMLRARGTGLIK